MEDPVFHALITYTKALTVALGYRDPSTRLHSERVQGLSEEIGLHCGLSKNEINALNVAASFHDIGKIGIPDRILLKPSRFDDAEWEIIKQHSEIGEQILSAMELDGAKQAARVIRHHHEHYDGSGYPDQLSGANIPICSRIIAIADSYDAMAVSRTYHHARTHTEIMDIMNDEIGIKHDSELMRVFCVLIETSKFKAKKI